MDEDLPMFYATFTKQTKMTQSSTIKVQNVSKELSGHICRLQYYDVTEIFMVKIKASATTISVENTPTSRPVKRPLSNHEVDGLEDVDINSQGP